MKLKLLELLEGLGFVQGETLFLQGSLAADEAYPADFVTYWVESTEDNSHYDNACGSSIWTMSVMYYSIDPVKTNTVPQTIRSTLRAAGFIPLGRGNDIASDEPTHTGWAQTFLYKKFE